MSVMFATVELQNNSIYESTSYKITIYNQLGDYSSTTVFNSKEELISTFMSKGYIPGQFSVEVITFTKQCVNHIVAEEAIKAIKKSLV